MGSFSHGSIHPVTEVAGEKIAVTVVDILKTYGNRIKRLYKEDKSIREIAKQMYMSFRDIGAIIKGLKSETERERPNG